MWETYVDSDGGYSFRYLAPPWELVTDADDEHPTIAVEPDPDGVGDSTTTGVLQARFKVVVFRRAQTAEAAAESDAEMLLDLGADTVETTSFKSARGREGLHSAAVLSDRKLRAVYHDLPGGGSVAMQAVGRDAVDGADFTLLLRGLEPSWDEAAP